MISELSKAEVKPLKGKGGFPAEPRGAFPSRFFGIEQDDSCSSPLDAFLGKMKLFHVISTAGRWRGLELLQPHQTTEPWLTGAQIKFKLGLELARSRGPLQLHCSFWAQLHPRTDPWVSQSPG